ncbi:hypothetical protein JY742_10470 [Clostridioides difficile]|nr:hypothetical protein [Clostridioides difficile]
MAKNNDLVQLKKGKSEFNLIGKVKINDFTFNLDVESSKESSDWVYNRLNLAIDCGKFGIIYCEMMGGYGTGRDNIIYVHGKKDKDGNNQDDFENRYTISWEDREDEEVLNEIGNMCFKTIGLEKDIQGKTNYKKFLTEYDAIAYMSDVLKDGMIVNIKGNLQYQNYKDTVQVKKNITSIALSNIENPEDFKATFTQSLLLDSLSIGKLDKETRSIPITAMIIERVQEYEDKLITRTINGKISKGANLPLIKTFNLLIGEDEKRAKQLLKQFKVKSSKHVTQLTIDGYFSRENISTVEVSEDDIPEDIKEMIELGYLVKEDIIGKMAKANGTNGVPEQMIIKAPHVVFRGEETKLPAIDKVIDIYTLDDVSIPLIMENLEIGYAEKELTEEEALSSALDDVDDTDDDDWLDEL